MRTHGLMKHRREYAAWLSAKTRCYNPRYHNFRHYGGRGILMADAWRYSFDVFFADLGPCPVGHSLDRIDNDGPYAPGNCRWADALTQHGNTRVNRILAIRGEHLTVAEWARRRGIMKGTIHQRLNMGWSAEDAVFRPVPSRLVTLNGVTRTKSEWLRVIGIKRTTVKQRLGRGMSIEQALTAPVPRRRAG